MKRISITSIALAPTDARAVGKAWGEVSASFDRFYLAADVKALGAMMRRTPKYLASALTGSSHKQKGKRGRMAQLRTQACCLGRVRLAPTSAT
jgi:hypothetical protein